jgi:molecular chaperone HtpG
MRVSDVVPDIIQNEEVLIADEEQGDLAALPAIMRREVDTEAKLLTIADSESPLKGYRCFLALSDKAREDRGDFFLQPHRTSIVWGGQRVLFVFEHHSGTFGLYYDLQTAEPVTTSSGGGPFSTATIVLGNRLFIPVPSEIAASFIPSPTSRKRFGVRCDVIYTSSDVPADFSRGT